MLRAPAGWVEQLVITVTQGGEQVWQGERAAIGPITIPASVSTSGELHIEAAIRDAFGNRLLAAQTQASPAAALSQGTPLTEEERLEQSLSEDDDEGGVFSSPVFWVVVGLAVAGGVVAAIVLSSETTYTLGQPNFDR